MTLYCIVLAIFCKKYLSTNSVVTIYLVLMTVILICEDKKHCQNNFYKIVMNMINTPILVENIM